MRMRLICGGVCIFAAGVILGCALAKDAPLPGALEAGWEGERVCELLDEDEHVRVLRCTFPPGVGHERHFHPPHFGYILTGGQMRIDDGTEVEERTLESDRFWTSAGVAQHEVLNIGESTQRYLIVEKKY